MNTRQLVDRIWSEVAAEEMSRRDSDLADLPPFEPLLEDDERRYINAHLVFDRTPAGDDKVERTNALKRRLKARAAGFVVGVLERYFDDEEAFMAHLVRLQNKLTVEHDRLSREVRFVQQALRAESDRLRTLDARLEERISELEGQLRAIPSEDRT